MSSRFRIALLGVGTVGSAVARRLAGADADAAPRGLQFTPMFDRRADRKRHALSSAGVHWTSRIDEVLQSDADVIVEAVGGIDPAADWIRDLLLAGKSVVTADKQVMAVHGPALLTLPRVILGLEAATHRLTTTVNAGPAEHAGEDSLRGLCVDRRLYAEAV